MQKYILIMSCALFLAGCELFVIGSKTPPKKIVNFDRQTALGTVYLFKAELDSNNLPGATDVLASRSAVKYLPVERHAMQWDVARLRRKIAMMPVTDVRSDTITPASMKIKVEFDYLRTFYFTTSKISNEWYITGYHDDNGLQFTHDFLCK